MALLAILTALAPEPFATELRCVVRDCLRPGQQGLELSLGVVESTPGLFADSAHEPTDDAAIATLQQTILELQRQIRVRDIQSEQVAQARRLEAGPLRSNYSAAPSDPLLVPELINARVIGSERSLGTSPRLLIDRGDLAGVDEMATLLAGPLPVIDQGTDQHVLAGQPVYSGSCVIGRIAAAGRLVSTVVSITSSEYSGRARLARTTSSGCRFGAEGIIQGDGSDKCLLTGIPPAESVAVGDDVYTGGRPGHTPGPMYYGRVVSARLSGESQWIIRVQPAANLQDVRDVVVLRESLNPIRILGQ